MPFVRTLPAAFADQSPSLPAFDKVMTARYIAMTQRWELMRSPEEMMPVQLNHTIMWVHDQKASAEFLTSILGLPEATRFAHFLVVKLDNEVSLDLFEKAASDKISLQHYAFLVSEAEFDEILGRIRERNLDYWADPARSRSGEINRHDGGRGLYFMHPSGHLLEIITRPYGSGSEP
jgi:catechol 2,3-dioxygenase-like lactoylglutathione lyase family enzyme